jgi:hypothetical protein
MPFSIDIGNDYRLTSDPHCVTIFKVGAHGEKSKTPGAEKLTAIGHYSDFADAAVGVLKHCVKCSEAGSIAQLAEDMKKAKAEILAAAWPKRKDVHTKDESKQEEDERPADGPEDQTEEILDLLA